MTAVPSVIVVVGPTGVGKTAYGVDLCERFGGEIVGADSVQVYRHFDIGSSKPSADELRGVPHHMLDVVEPDEHIDAARFASLAADAIADVHARGRVPVLVGGTGLWLRALLRGLLSLPPVDTNLRTELEARFDAEGAEALFATLRQIDPLTAEAVHPNDKLRVVRALEVHAQTGQALGELRRQHALGTPRYRTLGVFLDVPRETYRSVIQGRAQSMIERGFEAEVRDLIARFGPAIRPLGAVGYRQMREHLLGEADTADTLTAITRATTLYARRQRTWFRGDPAIDVNVTPAQAREPALLRRIEDFLASSPTDE